MDGWGAGHTVLSRTCCLAVHLRLMLDNRAYVDHSGNLEPLDDVGSGAVAAIIVPG